METLRPPRAARARDLVADHVVEAIRERMAALRPTERPLSVWYELYEDRRSA